MTKGMTVHLYTACYQIINWIGGKSAQFTNWQTNDRIRNHYYTIHLICSSSVDRTYKGKLCINTIYILWWKAEDLYTPLG